MQHDITSTTSHVTKNFTKNFELFFYILQTITKIYLLTRLMDVIRTLSKLAGYTGSPPWANRGRRESSCNGEGSKLALNLIKIFYHKLHHRVENEREMGDREMKIVFKSAFMSAAISYDINCHNCLALHANSEACLLYFNIVWKSDFL